MVRKIACADYNEDTMPHKRPTIMPIRDIACEEGAEEIASSPDFDTVRHHIVLIGVALVGLLAPQFGPVRQIIAAAHPG